MAELPPLDAKDPVTAYIKGDPVEIIGASGRPRILVVGLHGNEELAPRIAYYLQTERPDLLANVDYICGNPVAAAQQTRSSDPMRDLNRSFVKGKTSETYEEEEAQKLLARVGDYDFVLDVHTSETECGRFFLAASAEEPAVKEIVAASTIDRVVVLPPEVAGSSLIGNVTKSISVEYNEELAREPRAMQEMVLLLEGLIGHVQRKRQRHFFHVDHAVPKTEDPGDVQNFERCEAGYYPVLFGVGPKSYRNDPSKTYLGFAATTMTEVTL